MNIEKEKRAIQYLKSFEPENEPYYLCYSGGKDSDVIRILASLSGVKHEIVNNHTTVDAPETVRYIREVARQNSNMRIEMPKRTMWQLIADKGTPPTRIIRYCCKELKERGGKDRVKITGVRWEESAKRRDAHGVVDFQSKPKTTKKLADAMGVDYEQNKWGYVILNTDNAKERRFVEQCIRTSSVMVNPIVDWTESEVWEFLHYYGCESNPLYKKGRKRIGCIGCPLASAKQQKKDFEEYPTYKKAYIRAFDKMIQNSKAKGIYRDGSWENGQAVFDWWLNDQSEDRNQMTFEQYMNENGFDVYENGGK